MIEGLHAQLITRAALLQDRRPLLVINIVAWNYEVIVLRQIIIKPSIRVNGGKPALFSHHKGNSEDREHG